MTTFGTTISCNGAFVPGTWLGVAGATAEGRALNAAQSTGIPAAPFTDSSEFCGQRDARAHSAAEFHASFFVEPRDIPFESPLFRDERARLACLDTIAALRSMFDPETTPPGDLKALDLLIAHLGRPFADQAAMRQSVALTAGILDVLVLDEMAADRHDWFFRTTYGRLDGIRFGDATRLALPRAEAPRVFERLGKDWGVRLKSISDIAAHPAAQKFHLAELVHRKRLGETYRLLCEATEGRTAPADVVFGADFDSAVLFLRREFRPCDLYGEKTENCWNTLSSSALFPPMTSMPRQDLWRALLACGEALLDFSGAHGPQEPQPGRSASKTLREMRRTLFTHPRDAGDEDRESSRQMRRLEVLVRNAHDSAKLAALEANHARHYERLFEAGGERPHVLLTRSGVSANEIAIDAVARLATDRTDAYVHRGWYYENVRSIHGRFTVTQRLQDARCCFVNLLPCFPERFMRMDRSRDPDAAEYFSPLETIRLFLAKAGWERDKRHYLVVDKTSEPLFSLPPAVVPANVELIETASLTKHQRGARNYFFGAVAARSGPDVSAALDRAKARATAGLTPFGIANLPRLTATEIAARTVHIRSLNRTFAEAFEAAQGSLPERFRASTEVHDSFVYIIPPIELALGQVDALAKDGALRGRRYVDRHVGADDDSRLRTLQHISFGALEEALEKPLKAMGVFLADSFGLSDTRIISISYDFAGRWMGAAPRFRHGLLLTGQALRIAAGFAENAQTIAKKGGTLSSFIASDMRTRMKLGSP